MDGLKWAAPAITQLQKDFARSLIRRRDLVLLSSFSAGSLLVAVIAKFSLRAVQME